MYPTAMRSEDIGVFADPKDIGELVEPLRSRIYTAHRDAHAYCGWACLYLNSGRRSPWQQYLLRVERVGRANAFNPAYSGYPVTALPYRSKHQQGKAADEAGVGLRSFLHKYGSRYGLVRTVSSEEWHYEAIGQPTVRIIPYGGSSPSPSQELFTVSQYEALKDKLDTGIAWMMKAETQMNELQRVNEANNERIRQIEAWMEITTKRVRELHEQAGLG